MGAASRAAGRRLQTPRSRKSPNKGATFASRAPICPPVAASQLPPPTRRSIMLTTHPFDDDKLSEDCGVFGICGADSAAAVVALGLHALKHRGQEAAGQTACDGTDFRTHSPRGQSREERR